MATVSEQGTSVVLSSHLVSDIERVCDYLVVMVSSRVALIGEVDELLSSHHRLVGPRTGHDQLPANQFVVEASHTERQSTLLVRSDGPVLDPRWTIEQVGMEDLVLAYMGRSRDTDAQGGRP
jgi:ABC-2 type transport system ATP-binding protein